MKKYKITIEQLTRDEFLDYDDRGLTDENYYFQANDKEEALDEFHSTIPIACLEHFDITIKEVGSD